MKRILGQSHQLTKIQVDSLAKPVAGPLLAARTAIRVSTALQELFIKAKAEQWSADALADALYIRLPEYVIETDGLWDIALYLADEFFQLGDQLLLVSKETGQVIARLSEGDIYQPDLVARETFDGSTRLAKPLPRLRPDLEGLLVEWQFTKGHEAKLMTTISARSNQTELLRQEGDDRLLRVTRNGRKQISERLQEVLPELLQSCTGSAKDFLNLCIFCTDPFEIQRMAQSLLQTASCTGFAKIIMPVVDPLTFNIRHDPFTSLKSQIGSRWAREIARVLSAQVYGHGQVLDGSVYDPHPEGFWVGAPNVVAALGSGLAVVGASSVRLHAGGPVAYILINPKSYQCKSREFLGRWEVGASFEFTLYIDPARVSAYDLKDVPESGVVAEVVLS